MIISPYSLNESSSSENLSYASAAHGSLISSRLSLVAENVINNLNNSIDVVKNIKKGIKLIHSENLTRLETIKLLTILITAQINLKKTAKSPLYARCLFEKACLLKLPSLALLLRNSLDKKYLNDKSENLLHFACLTGDEELVNAFLVKRLKNFSSIIIEPNKPFYKPLFEVNQFGETPLHYAIRAGHTHLVITLFSSLKHLDRTSFPSAYLSGSLLHHAISKNNLELVEFFLKNDCFIHDITCEGKTPLHLAAESENHKIVEMLLNAGAQVNAKDFDDKTPLHLSFVYFSKELSKLLIDRGADVNSQDKQKNTPLHCAIKEECLLEDLINLKLITNLTQTAQNVYGETPLHVACRLRKENVALYLLSVCDCSSIKDINLLSPFHLACQYGLKQVARVLISTISDINEVDSYGSYLYLAYTSGNLELIAFLYEAGANRHAPLLFSKSYFEAALIGGRYEALHVLLNEITLPRDKHKIEYAAEQVYLSGVLDKVKVFRNLSLSVQFLGLADLIVESGSLEVFQFALDTKLIDVDSQIVRDHLLFKSCFFGHLEVTKKLVELKADINFSDVYQDGKTCLYVALENGHDLVAHFLLDQNPVLTTVIRDGFTLMHAAAKGGYLSCLERLFERGLSPLELNKKQVEPIDCVPKGRPEAFLFLRQKGGVRFRGRNHTNELIEACFANDDTMTFLIAKLTHKKIYDYCHDEMITVRKLARLYKLNYLLRFYNDHFLNAEYRYKDAARVLSERNKHGENHLLIAAKNGQVNRVELCLDHHLNINSVNDNGQTALHLAAVRGHLEVVRLLIEQKAELNVICKKSYTPLYQAALSGHSEIVVMLIEAGATDDFSRNEPTIYDSFLRVQANKNHLSDVAKRLIELNFKSIDEERSAIKFLGHSLSASGTTPFYGSELALQSNSLSSTFAFYNKMVKPGYAALRQGKVPFERVWNLLSAETKAILKDKGNLELILKQMPTLFDYSVVGNVNPEMMLERFKDAQLRNQPLMVLGRWEGHIIGFTFTPRGSDWFITLANKGGNSGKTPGLISYKVTDLNNLLPHICHLQSISKEFFLEGVKAFVDTTTYQYHSTKTQKVGNCTLATLRLVEFSALYRLFEAELGLQAAEEVARLVKRERVFQSRQIATELYLKPHLEGTPCMPIDMNLIHLIRRKKKHEPVEVYEERCKLVESFL